MSGIDDMVARQPDVLAVDELSYADLAQRVLGWVAAWAEAGRPSRLSHVAVHATEVAVCLLGAQHVGAALLLLDKAGTPAEHDRGRNLFGTDGDTDGRAVALIESPARSVSEPGLGLLSSGVEQEPKCVERPWASVLANAENFGGALELEPGDVLGCTTPPHHSYAANAGLLTSLSRGASYRQIPRQIGPDDLARLIDAHRVDVLLSVPVLYRWYARGLSTRHHPRLCVSAGAPLDDVVARAWRAGVGWPLVQHYGTSEFGMLTLSRVDAAVLADLCASGSVGGIVPGVELAIGREGDAGTQGQVRVRVSGHPPTQWSDAPHVVTPDRSVIARRLDGWQPTGDLGSLVDGVLTLTGREAGVFNIGGNKVTAAEIEAAAQSHPSVRACVVYAETVQGPLRAVAESGPELNPAELKTYLRTLLSAYKVPGTIDVVESLPRVSGGKLIRRPLPPSASSPSGHPEPQ